MNNIMSTLYGAIDDFFKFNMLPAVLNIDSNGTRSVSPRASAGTLRVKWR